jgi:site-specific DNA-cytosine methylase
MKASLELFSGSKVVSKVFEDLKFDTWTVDINKKFTPRICCNILDFNYSLFPKHFNVIWASPDCCTFSRAALPGQWHKTTTKYRQYDYLPISEKAKTSLELLYKTIEIIEHFAPALWLIENPVGRLRHIKALKLFAPYRYSVNYKDFGFPYSKETDIYTNQLFSLKTIKTVRPGLSVNSINGKFNRSVVPYSLVEFLITHANL